MRRTLLVALLLAAGPGPAAAHPHIWVTYGIGLPLGPRGLEAVEFVWTFDELFSGMILADAGGRGDAATRVHLRTLRSIPYVIEVAVNGVPVPVGEVRDLAVSVAGAQVTYRFSIPLSMALAPPGVIDIHVDDPGLFTAFTLRAADPAEIRSSGPFRAACERVRRPSGAPGPLRCVLEPGAGREPARR
jgi:ABC-type uncharacterized transport system substrate-binding protein